jgi:hypothetical protein
MVFLAGFFVERVYLLHVAKCISASATKFSQTKYLFCPQIIYFFYSTEYKCLID